MDFSLRFSQLPKMAHDRSTRDRQKKLSKKGKMKGNDTNNGRTYDNVEGHKGRQKVAEKKPIMTVEERRRIANERERLRVHALSAAFDDLRRVIPCYSSEQRLSKLSILRVAINYIAALGVMNRGAKKYGDVVLFREHVNECTITLQSEYGRAKKQTKLIKLNKKRIKDKRGQSVVIE